MRDDDRRGFLLQTLTTLVNDQPNLGNVTATTLMLLICGMTLGTLTPELAGGSAGTFGPAVTAFFAGIGGNLFSGVIEKLRAKKDSGASLSRADVDELLALIAKTNLDTQLRDETFQLELRNQFTRLAVFEDLLEALPETSAKLVIDALGTQINLLSDRIVVSINTHSAGRFDQLSKQIADLTKLVIEAQGKRAKPREGAPPDQHVFISYARKDGETLARRLHDALEADSIPAWLDRYDIKPGDDWSASIQNAIEDCRLFVFVATPGSVASEICSNEYTHALSTKKPFFIAYHIDVDLPMRLNTMHYVEFKDPSAFDRGIAQLRQTLNELSAADPFNISPEQAAEQERRAITLIDADVQARSRSTAAMTRSKFPNPLPLIVGDQFKDRVSEQANIQSGIRDNARLITIVGRGGVGKTALVCKVLRDLEVSVDGSCPDGMVYLSAVRENVDVDRILADFAKLLSGTALDALDTVRKDPVASAVNRAVALLAALADGHYVLLIDNFETLQDPETHKILTDDLRAFLEALLERGGTLRVILTTRSPIPMPYNLKAQERIIPLDEGLPEADGVALLRELDADSTAGLRDASDADLAYIVGRVRGFPRALEAVRGWLLSDSLNTLRDVLADPALLSQEVTPIIVQQAIQRLDAVSTRVLEGLALFNRPVKQAALEYLLAPYLDTSTIRPTLSRLVGARFAAFNSASGTFALHPLDQQYLFTRIPEGTSGDYPKPSAIQLLIGSIPELDPQAPYTRYALRARAAGYFQRERKPQTEWKTLDDLAPQLAEFDYRVAADDYDTAARLLTNIDFDYLLLWGHNRLVIGLHERLQEHIENSMLSRNSLNILGQALVTIGRVNDAIRCFERALKSARVDRTRHGEWRHLANLGNAYRHLGQIPVAIDYFQQALAITRDIGDRRGEGNHLGSLGSVYGELGQLPAAIDHYHQALAIAREVGDRLGEGGRLGNLGLAYSDLGQLPAAIDHYQQAVAIAREVGDRPGEGRHLGNLGNGYGALGQLPTAIDCYQQALAIAREVGNRRGEGGNLENLGYILSFVDRSDEAVAYLRQALEISKDIASMYLEQYCRHELAEVFAVLNRLDAARDVIIPARALDVADNNHLAAAIHGIILARLGDPGAADAFSHSIRHADTVLASTPNLYRALYARALARAGLALLRGDDLTPSIDDYRAARAITAADGIIMMELRRLDLLMMCPGGDRLAPARAVLIGDS